MGDVVTERELVPYTTVAETLADLKSFVPQAIYKRAFCGTYWEAVEAAADKNLDDSWEGDGSFKDLVFMYITNIAVDNLRMELSLGQRGQVDDSGAGIGVVDLNKTEKDEIRATLDGIGDFLARLLGVKTRFIIAYPEDEELVEDLRTVGDVMAELDGIIAEVPDSIKPIFDTDFLRQMRQTPQIDLTVSEENVFSLLVGTIREHLRYLVEQVLEQEVMWKLEDQLKDSDREIIKVHNAIVALINMLDAAFSNEGQVDEGVPKIEITCSIETDYLENIVIPQEITPNLVALILEKANVSAFSSLEANFRIFGIETNALDVSAAVPCFTVNGYLEFCINCEKGEESGRIPLQLMVPFENVTLKAGRDNSAPKIGSQSGLLGQPVFQSPKPLVN